MENHLEEGSCIGKGKSSFPNAQNHKNNNDNDFYSQSTKVGPKCFVDVGTYYLNT